MARDIRRQIEALEAALAVDGFRVNVGRAETIRQAIERVRAARAQSVESNSTAVADSAPEHSPEENSDLQYWRQERPKLTSYNKARDAVQDFETHDRLKDYRGRDAQPTELELT